MKIKLVRQEDEFGCTIACLAMVLGKTYKEIKKDFVNKFQGNEDGLTIGMLIDYLGDQGCEVVSKMVDCYNQKDFGRDIILMPFAPVHILNIKHRFDTTLHAVVMDNKGKIFCPDGATEEEVRDSYKFNISRS